MKDVFTIFASPEKTFQRVKSSSHISWIFPMIVLMALTSITVYFQMPIIEQGILDSFKSNPQIAPETYESLITGTKISTYVMGLLSSAILLFLGGLLFMLLNLIVRGEGKYMQLVSLVAYAALPGAVGGVLSGILLMITDAQAVSDVTISLGSLIPDKEGMLYNALSLIDPFTIWTLLLYVIGASVMMNRSKKQVGTWIVIVWAIFSVGSLLVVNNLA